MQSYDELLTKPILDAIRNALHYKYPLLIYGEPGTGKTSSVQYLASTIKNCDFIEFNASDNIRLKETEHKLYSLITEIHQFKYRIVLLDELDQKSNLQFIEKLIEKNKETANKTNTIVICITNHVWKLKRLVDAFMGNTIEAKPPHQSIIKKFLKKYGKTIMGQVPRDLRVIQKILDTDSDNVQYASRQLNSFQAFQKYLSSHPQERKTLPDKRTLGHSLQDWLLANSYDENIESFVRRNETKYYQIIEALSFADLYQTSIPLFFLPKFMASFGSVKHPSTISRFREINTEQS